MQKVLNGNTKGMLLPYKTWLFTSWKGTIYTEDKREENINCFVKNSSLITSAPNSQNINTLWCDELYQGNITTAQRHTGVMSSPCNSSHHKVLLLKTLGKYVTSNKFLIKTFYFIILVTFSNFGWLLTVFYLIKVDFGLTYNCYCCWLNNWKINLQLLQIQQ